MVSAAAVTVLAMAHHPTSAHGGGLAGLVHGVMIVVLVAIDATKVDYSLIKAGGANKDKGDADVFDEVVMLDVVPGLAAGLALDLWHSSALNGFATRLRGTADMADTANS